MAELVVLLSVYYKCAALAETGSLTQAERFACNNTYQEAKRHFVDDEPGAVLTPEQNRQAYLRFKSWEAENADLIAALKQQ
ncbi:MAG: hypothetical protein AAFO97_07435 [Pseudomonadota bacterium]